MHSQRKLSRTLETQRPHTGKKLNLLCLSSSVRKLSLIRDFFPTIDEAWLFAGPREEAALPLRDAGAEVTAGRIAGFDCLDKCFAPTSRDRGIFGKTFEN